jgi:hypothetical protein
VDGVRVSHLMLAEREFARLGVVTYASCAWW